jgi:ATP-dependent exoDNAse (exonuclease V) alpha subunit/ribonuclease D
MIIKRTEEFNLAYRFVTETNQNIFLTGKAGTGKTTFLKYLQENSVKNIVVAAPTGVAAINARGVTLHSLFQLPFGIILPDLNSVQSMDGKFESHPLLSKIHYSREKLDLLRSMELLVIDEASMVASYIVDAIDTILRFVRRKPYLPFGGVQLLLIGDLYQLPPVVKKEDWEILQSFYSSAFFFDSLILRHNIPVIIELKEIFRQKDDKFIEILNGIRNNNISEENFRLLNLRLQRNFIPNDTEGYITLTTHNYQSAEINKGKLNNIQARTHTFYAEIDGEFPEHTFPAEEELKLKSGAQVMFLKNDLEEKKYFNGKIGIITRVDDGSIKVKCKDDFDEIEVKKCEWQNISYKINSETREIKEEILGRFIQYPLRLAWAITIHKSQGLTFDKVVIDAERAFAIGQVYVALSRCTSLEGLILNTPVYRNFLGAHEDLREWLYNNKETNFPQMFVEARQNFILRELQNIFTWNNWYYELRDLKELLLENPNKISSESVPWLNELMQKQKELYEVSEKFKLMIIQRSKEYALGKTFVEEDDHLQKRIKDGANYFYNEISKWEERFFNHPLSAETKKLSRKTDRKLEEISFILQEILQKINYCKNGFLLDDFLRNAKFFTQRGIKKIRSSYSKDKTASSMKDIPHPELFRKLIELRDLIESESDLVGSMIFSDKAIKTICINLPMNKNELRKIKGFGNAKVEIYGDKVMPVIKEYYRTNNIDLSQRENFDVIITQPYTVEVTIRFFREGKSIEQIAKERNLVVSTIESHFAQAIRINIIQIEEIMPIDEARKISEYFPQDLSDVKLTPIKENAPPEITYGKLRMVLAWLQKGRL